MNLHIISIFFCVKIGAATNFPPNKITLNKFFSLTGLTDDDDLCAIDDRFGVPPVSCLMF